MKKTTIEKAKYALKRIDEVLELHQRFHAFAINNDRVQLLINTNKVIEGLVETRKMFETHLINEGIITRIPVQFIETPKPPALKVIPGGGQTTNYKILRTLHIVPPKTTN